MSEKKPTYEELENLYNELKKDNQTLSEQLYQASYDYRWLKSLFLNLQMGIVIESKGRFILGVNPAFCQLFGFASPDQIEGVDCGKAAKDAAILFDDPEQFITRINEILDQNRMVLNEPLSLKDGRTLERDFVPVFEEGTFMGNLWIYRDITERKEAEERLRESEDRYRKLIENMEEGVILENPEGQIIECNKKAAQILSLEVNKLKGQNSFDFIFNTVQENGEKYPPSEYPVTKTLEAGIPVRDGIMGVVKDDKTITWIKINSEPIYFSGSSKCYAIVTFSDITDLIEKEQRMTELNATKDKMFSVLSHDLRNPSNAILSLSEMMVENIRKENYSDLTIQGEYIKKSAQQSLELINNLMHWSRFQSGRMEYNEKEVNINEIIHNIMDLFKASLYEKALTINLQLENNGFIKGDAFMLDLVIRNFVSNAIKFTPKRGSITIKSYQSPQWFHIEMQDTGIGMTKEEQDNLFDISKKVKKPGTNNEKGTGLGLVLCKEFIDFHEGVINVDSKERVGSTFTISIPLHL